MLKIGDVIINLAAIAYVELQAKKSYVTKGVAGVRIHMLVKDGDDIPATLFFSGENAEKLRKYFQSVVVEVGVLI
jgi:hypothetical protein